MAGFHSMAALFLLLGMLAISFQSTGAEIIGVCYGRDGNDLPSAREVVEMCKSRNIGRMRLYYPDQGTLQALGGSNIELMLGVPNSDLQALANDATSWVRTNVLNYWPSVKFRYIAVGNEVSPINGNSQYTSFVLPAMRNVYNALASAGLQNQIRVSTAIDNGQVDPSYPPSAGAFRGDVQWFMNPIVGYLVSIGSPLLVNVYPYFSYINSAGIKYSYATFTNPGIEFTDGSLTYWNLFDAILDAHYSALERLGGSNVEIVVSESGWPSAGGTATTIENARTYNQNLIYHVLFNGTPKRPSRTIETYLFAMFNENQKNPEFERNFGLFYPNKQPVYPIDFAPGRLQSALYASS